MNVKSLIGNIPSPTEFRSVNKAERAIKSDVAHDRDANGQQTPSQNQEQREPMTEEQLREAVEHLQDLPGVKEHSWTIELEFTDFGKFILVRDNLRNIIRRIPELELWTLETDSQLNGHLLKKTA
jgi:hypothetical protein